MWACFAATYGVIKSDAPDYMHGPYYFTCIARDDMFHRV